MNKTRAENIAIEAFHWVAADAERAAGFMGVSGASFEDLQGQASNPEFLGFVLDYLMMDDQKIMAFSDEFSVPPQEVAIARQVLAGGDAPDWM